MATKAASHKPTIKQQAKRPPDSMCHKLTIVALLCLLASTAMSQQQQSKASSRFPGVSRELESFCAARPSLQIDLAAMVVHVKRNLSFNYKLYLFSGNQVFQTGQIVPRDHFKIHAFPVKLKPLTQFWPKQTPTFRLLANGSMLPTSGEAISASQFLRTGLRWSPSSGKSNSSHHKVPEDARGDLLPGDPAPTSSTGRLEPDLNRHIEFDRDDQLSLAVRRDLETRHQDSHSSQRPRHGDEPPVPVAAFSSFQLNSTYLARKDFDQLEPEIVQLQISAQQFQVQSVVLLDNQTAAQHQEQFQFLAHKLIRGPDTRLLAISQIYEDWITRNFYTVVYVERRFRPEEGEQWSQIDRLVFRGSSAALLGAEQLDQTIRAAAFVTERSGLHYFVEFHSGGRFRLAAVDWSRRPFKMIDSRGLPMRATETELDNEELLLCPPAVCYANRPMDELVAYGRLAAGETPAAKLKLRLHLRDWIWPLTRRADGNATGFQLDYAMAARNEIKAKQDSYGYLLTGHEIDASYRVSNELYLISANHLISINYTLANETVTSSQLLSDEFQGLSSTLLDPITGALYHEPSRRIYFFKGNRYLIYDQVSRKPLDGFTLQQPPLELLGQSMDQSSLQGTVHGPLVSSLPVAELFGRQLEVDSVYHDLATDLVYVFSGMKFFTFKMENLKPQARSRIKGTSMMRCINEHFLSGCLFDLAFPNPCKESPNDRLTMDQEQEAPASGDEESTRQPTSSPQQDLGFSDELGPSPVGQGKLFKLANEPAQSFYEQQQMKLRSIAASQQPRTNGSLLAGEQTTTGPPTTKQQAPASAEINDMWPSELNEPINDHEPFGSSISRPLAHHQAHEQILMIYLLVAVLLLTLLASLLVVFILLRQWALRRESRLRSAPEASRQKSLAASRYLRNQQVTQHRYQEHPSKPMILTSVPVPSQMGGKLADCYLTPTGGFYKRQPNMELNASSTDSSAL